ncbi:MAG: hypothetical protein Q6362_012175 [Candidatus Wukongarchaeota archaeon]|nr:hypothetical protein [Candidatus Wukongarchaeota archaeon]
MPFSYSSFLSDLSRFNNIFVSGPQRSGTRFASTILACDLKRHFIDEVDFGVGNSDKLLLLLSKFPRSVIQCPGMVHLLLDLVKPDDAIVFMFRPIKEILASENRIQWPCNSDELKKLNVSSGNSCEHKYSLFESTISKSFYNCFRLDYESLSGHPSWVSKKGRSSFVWNQTS